MGGFCMPKRNRPSSKSFKIRHPREVGKFYKISDSSGGHPVRVYYCDIENDIYFVQRFSSKPRKDRIKLSHGLNPNVESEEYLVKKPVAVGYDNIKYCADYVNFCVNSKDEQILQKYQKFDLKKKTDERASNDKVSRCDASSVTSIKAKTKDKNK